MDYEGGGRAPGTVVADQVRRLRESRGWSQEDLADELDWKQAKVSRLERGSRGISVDDLMALALALNCSPAHLLTPSEPVAITREVVEDASVVREWVRGQKPLPNQDAPLFWTSLSSKEWEQRESPEISFLLSTVQDYSSAALEGDIEDAIAALGDIIHAANGIRTRLQRALDKFLGEEGGS
jgi:transcriptional regulator with XRE-family HTH domain